MYSHLEVSLSNNENVFNPFLFSDMKSATEVIENKINQKKRILLYAVNNIDSVLSIGILLHMFQYLNAEVEFIMQDLSLEDEYLLLKNQIEFLNCKLLILIGNNHNDECISKLKMNTDIDILLVNNEKKKYFDCGIIHLTPYDEKSGYPFRDLNLLVIIYKFIQAVSSRYKTRIYKKYLDILVLKFLADDKELKGESLELYNEGISKIKKTNNIGILSMVKYMDINDMNDYDAFKIISVNIFKFYNLKFEKIFDKINNIKILIELLSTNSNDRAEQIVKYFCNLCLIKNKRGINMDLKEKIRVIEDFPKEGISFKDITTILSDKYAFKYTIDALCRKLKDKGAQMVVAPESRGFIYATPIAYAVGAGFAPVRKKGKLPAETVSINYNLEYGSDDLEIHKDAFEKGTKIAIVDDLLATGGTILAVAELVEKLGGEVVSIVFPIELTGLKGREKLSKYDVFSLVQYDF